MTIQKIKRKCGFHYRIRVSMGYSDDGKQIVKSMTYTPEPGLTERQAYKEATRIGLDFEQKCKLGRVPNRRMTFEQVGKDWIQLIETTDDYKPSTVCRLKGLQKRSYKALGPMNIENVTYQAIQSFILSLSEEGLSQKTQKHYINFVSDVLRYAMKCGYITVNVCRNISTVKLKEIKQQVYTPEEATLILTKINESAPLKYKVFFNILAFTGLRRGECLGIEYKDVDFDSGSINIERVSYYQHTNGTYTSTPKTKTSERIVYVPKSVLSMIKIMKTESQAERLFITETGAPMHPNTPYHWLYRFCDRLNLPFKGLHAFRHFVASQAFDSGVNIKAISAFLGHSQTSVTIDVYTHLFKDANKQISNVLSESIEKRLNKDPF